MQGSIPARRSKGGERAAGSHERHCSHERATLRDAYSPFGTLEIILSRSATQSKRARDIASEREGAMLEIPREINARS